MDDLAPVIQLFARNESLLDPAREAMLNYGLSILGSAERLALTTPDGGHVDGVLLGGAALRAMASAQPRSTAEDATAGCRGVVVYFGGNGEHYELHQTLVQEWGAKRRFAVLLVNYRGVGQSGGVCGRTSGVLDCLTALSFLFHGLGVPQNRIVVIGHSIGGGYSTEACTFFPSALCINDRSFGSLSSVAQWHVLSPLVDGPLAHAWWATLARAAFVFLFRHIACWELDSCLHWSSLPKNSKIVVSSGEDRVIPGPAQLWAALQDRPAAAAGVGAQMGMDRRGPGEDAHNVDWERRECDRLDAAITRFLKGHPLGDVL
jgi:pimeloyl-ACP methyl ester carboxylesterase